jgi:hypothetical protein
MHPAHLQHTIGVTGDHASGRANPTFGYLHLTFAAEDGFSATILDYGGREVWNSRGAEGFDAADQGSIRILADAATIELPDELEATLRTHVSTGITGMFLWIKENAEWTMAEVPASTDTLASPHEIIRRS